MLFHCEKAKEDAALPASYDQGDLRGLDGKCCYQRMMQVCAYTRARTHTHTHTHTKDLLFYLSRWELKIGRDGNVLWQVHFCKHRTRKTKSALWSRQAGKSLSIDMATSREDSGKYTYFQSPHATVKV